VPRYFFHLHNDIDTTDMQGRMLPNDEAAELVAISEARAIMSENVLKGKIDLSHNIVVRDEAARHVATIDFGEALQIVRSA
jgi:hypothetical protein